MIRLLYMVSVSPLVFLWSHLSRLFSSSSSSGEEVAETAVAEPAEAEPAEAEPADAEPAETEPAEAEPAETEPAVVEPAVAESAAESRLVFVLRLGLEYGIKKPAAFIGDVGRWSLALLRDVVLWLALALFAVLTVCVYMQLIQLYRSLWPIHRF